MSNALLTESDVNADDLDSDQQDLAPAAAVAAPDKPAMGIVYGEPDGIYHATRAISWHRLAVFDPAAGGNPAKYHREVVQGLRSKSTKSKSFGGAAHTLLLEGERAFIERYKEVPKGYALNKNPGKAWKSTFQKSNEAHKRLIKAEEAETLRMMEINFRGNAEVREALASGKPEVVVRRVEPVTGLLRQIRFDWLDEERVSAADLKTSSNPVERFGYEVQEYFYHRQVAWYSRIYMEERLGTDDLPFSEIEPFAQRFPLLAVETFPTWRVQSFNFDSETLRNADAANQKALYELAYCYQNNVWPDGTGGTVTLSARS